MDEVNLPATDYLHAIAWNGTVFCAIAGGANASIGAAISPDGVSWTSQNLPSSNLWYSIDGLERKSLLRGSTNITKRDRDVS